MRAFVSACESPTLPLLFYAAWTHSIPIPISLTCTRTLSLHLFLAISCLSSSCDFCGCDVVCRRKENAAKRIQARQKGIIARKLARQKEEERLQRAKVQRAIPCGGQLSSDGHRRSKIGRWLRRLPYGYAAIIFISESC